MQHLPKIAINIETSSIWGRALSRGIVKYTEIHGPWMFYRQPPYYRIDQRKRLLSWVKRWQPDGIIMLEPTKTEETEIIKLGIPTIVSGYTKEIFPHFANIISDHKAMGTMAADHLIKRGFRFFAFCGYDNFFWSQARCKGFCDRVTQRGYEVFRYKQPKSKNKKLWENEQFILAEWLGTLPKPVGLMACIDGRSQNVVEACKIANINIPDEIAIVGVNNDELLCCLSPQPLSSVAIDAEKRGYEAAQLMDRMINGQSNMAGQIIIVTPTHVVSRQSTDTLAIDDREVARAIHYIRMHSKKLIQVDDVVNATTIAKRTLQKRFRKILGHSIRDEIRHIRIEQAIQMLMETNMPISEIALALGFEGFEHISRYFRKEKGMSLSAYRKKYKK